MTDDHMLYVQYVCMLSPEDIDVGKVMKQYVVLLRQPHKVVFLSVCVRVCVSIT